MLVQWRLALVAGGDLQLSTLKGTYPQKTFRHHQVSRKRTLNGQELARFQESMDDFHSPCYPAKYVEIRLQKWLTFYRQRVPRYAIWRYVYKAILAILAATAAVLSAYDCTAYALIVSSAAAMVTSWVEFTDIGHKIERYTRAIIAIGNHLSFWKSLSEVEKASPVMIGNLVQTGENIISDERIAWQLTGQSKDQMDEAQGERAAPQNVLSVGPGDTSSHPLRSRVHPQPNASM